MNHETRRTSLGGVILALLLLAAAPVELAQAAPGTPEALAATPRAALTGYLDAARTGDFARAAEFLDLRRIPRDQQTSQGPVLARQLRIVLDQTLVLDPETLSDDPGGQRDDGLPAHLERIGTLQTARGPVDVLLQHVPGPGGLAWKIAAVTVAQIPTLSREYGVGPLDEILPRVLLDVRPLDIALWQWIGLALLALGAWGVAWLVARLTLRALRPLAARSRTVLDDRLLEIVAGPLHLATALVLFFAGLLFLMLPLPVRTFFATAETATAIATAAWLAIRSLDVLAQVASDRLVLHGRSAARAVVPAGRRAMKVVVAGLAGIAILQNAGLNVTGILAGLGIGGLAVALAAQKTVENLFGGISLILDQPVRVGDFCRFGDKVGTIEEVGLRSTRVRTLDRTVIAVPNGEFAALQIENFAERDRVWLHTTLGLRYETTPDQMRWLLIEIRKMLYAHPKIHRDPARVRFVGLGAHSLDLEIFAYVLTPDYDEFLAVQEDVNLRLMDIVAASGTAFAVPSQATYVSRDTALDPARRQAAEAAVQAWRERGEIYLPEFPPEVVADLHDTLDYPPNGAAARRKA